PEIDGKRRRTGAGDGLHGRNGADAVGLGQEKKGTRKKTGPRIVRESVRVDLGASVSVWPNSWARWQRDSNGQNSETAFIPCPTDSRPSSFAPRCAAPPARYGRPPASRHLSWSAGP